MISSMVRNTMRMERKGRRDRMERKMRRIMRSCLEISKGRISMRKTMTKTRNKRENKVKRALTNRARRWTAMRLPNSNSKTMSRWTSVWSTCRSRKPSTSL
jgi:hypothetical protein